MIRINLLPVRAAKRKENIRKNASLLIGYVVILGILIGGAHLALKSMIGDAEARIADQKSTIVALDERIAQVKDYEKKLKELAEKVTVVVGLELKQRGPATYLKALAELVPEKLWIERIADQGGKIKISGTAIDQQTVSGFMNALELHPLFDKIEVIKVEMKTKAGYQVQEFTLETMLVLPSMMENKPDKKEEQKGQKAPEAKPAQPAPPAQPDGQGGAKPAAGKAG